MCVAKSEGLVRYPTALAPVSGSVTVTTQCADNAHNANSTSLNVTCFSSGSWSGHSLCYCDEGHHVITKSKEKKICRGLNAESFGKTCVECDFFYARPSE